MTNILGISAYYHDSAACLVRDGEVLEYMVMGLGSPQREHVVQEARHCHRPDPLAEWKRLLAGVDDVQMIERESVQRRTHGRRNAWAVGALDLEAEPALAANDEQIEFRAAVSRPEEALLGAGAEPLDDLLRSRSPPTRRRPSGGRRGRRASRSPSRACSSPLSRT